MKKNYTAIGAFFLAIAVILGAYASHGLTAVAGYAIVNSFKTGVTYQIYHAFGIMLVGITAAHISEHWQKVVLILFGIGIVLFCFDIYVLNWCKVYEWDRVLGMIRIFPPFGGIAFILGWIAYGLGLLLHKNKKVPNGGEAPYADKYADKY